MFSVLELWTTRRLRPSRSNITKHHSRYMRMSLLASAPSTLRPLLRSPPIFLAPALAKCQTSPFTTTPQPSTRKTRDGNPNRGVSALRRTGLKYAVGMSHTPLPKPVLDPKKRTKVETDPNHGLWGFFNKKRLLSTPEMDASHGMTSFIYL